MFTLPDLFTDALTYPAADRARFLDERCGENPTLRRQVEQLLACDARAEDVGFLARPPATGSRAVRPSDAPVVGGYALWEEIGRGGMGVVYRGERVGEFRHEVAVKLGPPGAADGRLLERFRAERQLLAALDHPNIARLYDGGATDDGRLYFVMELVKGDRLDRYAEARHLSARERVRLFVPACRAVAFAHERKVIHRDLKPGNILVTNEGVVKVVDFGLATRAALGDADATLTYTGELLGTPGYCPPEQARGQANGVTPAADVFALGATLYALLSGRPPFHADSQWESIRLTLEADPVPLSRLLPALPRDLESICLKCLEKDPARRYPTAAALADDLDRFLGGQPTVARPITTAQRAWRWARRHPLPAGLLSLLAVVIVASVATVTVLWRKAERSATAAQERNKTARAALKAYTAIADRLFRIPEQVSGEERQALTTALELYVQVLAEGSDDPEEECDQAYSTLRLAMSMSAIGETEAAERANRRAVETLQRLVDADPDRGLYAHHLAEGRIQLAGLLWGTGRHAEAVEMGVKAVRLAELWAARRADSPEYVGMCAALQAALGAWLTDQGQVVEGERHLLAAVVGCRQALRLQPGHWPRYSYAAHAIRHHASAVYTRTGSTAEYSAAVRPLFDLIDATVRDRPNDWPKLVAPTLPVARAVCAKLWRNGEGSTARRHLTRLAEVAGAIAHRRPTDRSAARDHALIQFDLALITENDAEAAGRFRAALHAVEPTADSPATAASLADRGYILAFCPHPAVRNTSEGVRLAREATRLDPGLLNVWYYLAACLSEAGDFPGAVEALDRFQPGTGDRWVKTSMGQLYKCLWQASHGERDAALMRLRAAESPFVEGDVTDLGLLILRDRTWRQLTGGPPPQLPTRRKSTP